MLLNSNSMNVMRQGLNALAVQQKIVLQNIANLETPNYKAQAVVFEEILETKKNEKRTVGVKAKVYTQEDTTVRVDGNNVDSDAENLKLYENYVQSLYLYNKVTSEINNYRYVIKQAPK